MGNIEKWIVDAEQIKQYPEDIDLYVDIALSEELSVGKFSDCFKCNEDEAIYVVYIKPEFQRIDWKKNIKKEYIFVVDRSGSMHGELIQQAKDALLLMIKSLPNDPPSIFNIYSFGSHFDKLWKLSRPYNDDNVADAEKHIREMCADYGGTELLGPLKGTCYMELINFIIYGYVKHNIVN